MNKQVLIQWINEKIHLLNENGDHDYVFYYLWNDFYSIKYNFKMIDKYYWIYSKILIEWSLDKIFNYIKDL